MSDDPMGDWETALAEWAIPEDILARASEPPWQLPVRAFANRADMQMARPEGISLRRAAEALDGGGSVLDVGAGGGAASLPLVPRMRSLVAVDGSDAMLDELRGRAARVGVDLTAICGRWPDVAGSVPDCDVVVCDHVLYNVPDIGPFVEALNAHARRRVVLEITARHPLSGTADLWQRFHAIARPTRPAWDDAVRALSSLGITPVVEHESRPDTRPLTDTFDDLVAWTRRQLCLSRDRDAEVGQALRDRGMDPDRPQTWSLRIDEVTVLWWDR